MRKKILMFLMISAFAVKQVKATDDVYVDLSVLDAVPQDSIGFIGTAPLFPEIKKQPIPAKKKIAPKPIKKQVKKAQKSPVVFQEPQITEPEIKQEPEEISVAMPEAMENIESPILPEIAPETAESVESPIPSENISKSQQQNEFSDSEQEIVAEDQINNEPVISGTQPIISESTGTQAESKQEQTVNPQGQEESLAEQQENQKEEILSAKISESSEKGNIIMPREVYSLRFDTDSSNLTDDHINYLNDLQTKLDPSRKKKISIKAYNYDNGEDSFRKKRISLVRATEVRSYFLNHGFKNFGIKIINTTADSEDKNTVEIEELN